MTFFDRSHLYIGLAAELALVIIMFVTTTVPLLLGLACTQPNFGSAWVVQRVTGVPEDTPLGWAILIGTALCAYVALNLLLLGIIVGTVKIVQAVRDLRRSSSRDGTNNTTTALPPAEPDDTTDASVHPRHEHSAKRSQTESGGGSERSVYAVRNPNPFVNDLGLGARRNCIAPTRAPSFVVDLSRGSVKKPKANPFEEDSSFSDSDELKDDSPAFTYNQRSRPIQ